METIKSLIPDIQKFYLLLENDKKVHIKKCNNINISFESRKIVKNNVLKDTLFPIITYIVDIDDENKKIMSSVFPSPGHPADQTFHNRSAKMVSTDGFVFPIQIGAIPSILYGTRDALSFHKYSHQDIFYNKNNLEKITIELFLDDTTICLFSNDNKDDERFKKYKLTRFELLDL